MSALPPPPAGGDVNRGAALLACIWTPFPFTVILLASRLFVRMRINGMGIDDYMMCVAWVLYTATFGIETANILQGGTRHIFYLTQDQIVLALKLTWISQPIGIMASAFGKCAVAFLIRRIVGGQNNWRKWFLYVNVALYLSVSIISSVLGFCQCKPADDIWAQVPGAKCWKPAIDADFDLFQSSYGAALDFCLALLPITIIWSLQLSLAKRIATCCLLGLGVFAGICASIKTAVLRNPINVTDFTWATYDIWIWTSLEISLVIICGCVPTLKPIWDRTLHGKSIGSYGSSKYSKGNEYTHPSSKSNRFGSHNHLYSASASAKGPDTTVDNEMFPLNNDIRVQHEYYAHSSDGIPVE